ncbi:MAG: DUF362 domain-containing protein [Proteobacteria bacterium]|nr:DUF362 domain-containing protein [Pseudomonadota bacterium]
MKKEKNKKINQDSEAAPLKSRREFMKSTATAGAALVVGVACNAEDADSSTDSLDEIDSESSSDNISDSDSHMGDGGPDDSSFSDIPSGQVVLVRSDTPKDAVARGIELMGSLDFIESGQTVVLKPNVTGPIVPPDITSPAVLVEMINQCYAAGAGEVIVAERTFGPIATNVSFDATIFKGGTKSMRMFVDEAGATYKPLDNDEWIEVSPEGAVDYEKPMLIPKFLTEVDHFINVPTLKTHGIAVFSMTLKNLFGFIHPNTRNGQVHGHPKNNNDPAREKRMFAQMNLPFNPTLNVLDAIVSRTTGGPTPPGDVKKTNMVLLGKDRVAMDAVGLAVLRVYGTEKRIEDKPVWQQVQLAEAIKIGIGVQGPDEVTLIGDGVDEIDEIEAKLREV